MENRINDAFEKIKAEEKLKADTLKYVSKKAAQKQHFPRRRPVLIACASTFLFFLIGAFSFNLYFAESAYIDIDVNPSIELVVNRFDRVIDAHPYNDDGKKILAASEVKHKSYDDAVAVLIDEMKEQGYLKTDGLVSATLRTDKEEQRRLAELKQSVAESLANAHGKAKHEVYAVDSATKEHAHQEHVSPAKYLAILELQKVDPTTTVEGCKDHSIYEIREEIGTHKTDNHDGNKDSKEQNGKTHDNRSSGHHGDE